MAATSCSCSLFWFTPIPEKTSHSRVSCFPFSPPGTHPESTISTEARWLPPRGWSRKRQSSILLHHRDKVHSTNTIFLSPLAWEQRRINKLMDTVHSIKKPTRTVLECIHSIPEADICWLTDENVNFQGKVGSGFQRVAVHPRGKAWQRP